MICFTIQCMRMQFLIMYLAMYLFILFYFILFYMCFLCQLKSNHRNSIVRLCFFFFFNVVLLGCVDMLSGYLFDC